MPELITTIHGHHLELRCWSKVVSYTAHAMIPQLSAAKKRARASDDLSVQGVYAIIINTIMREVHSLGSHRCLPLEPPNLEDVAPVVLVGLGLRLVDQAFQCQA